MSVSSIAGISLHASTNARICAGVVPQQPPSTETPSKAITFIIPANSSGLTWNEVLPSTTTGSPALGFNTIGSDVTSRRRGRNPCITSGPKPQLRPNASTLSPSSIATAASISAPVRSLPSSSNTIVTTIGRLVFSLAAKTAALISYVSFMVSIKQKSAPARSPAMHIGLNASYASSKVKSPKGSSNFPSEPISSAAYAFRPTFAIARFASAMPFSVNSSQA